MSRLRKHPGTYMVLAWVTGCVGIYEHHKGAQWVADIMAYTTTLAIVTTIVLLIARADGKDSGDHY